MTTQTNFRLSPETMAKLDELAKKLGPVVPLTRTDVVRVLIERAHAETQKPRRKNTKPSSLRPKRVRTGEVDRHLAEPVAVDVDLDHGRAE